MSSIKILWCKCARTFCEEIGWHSRFTWYNEPWCMQKEWKNRSLKLGQLSEMHLDHISIWMGDQSLACPIFSILLPLLGTISQQEGET